jgi:hypothetical protein
MSDNSIPTDAFEDAEIAREEDHLLRGALVNVLSNASNYPEKVQPRLLGQDMGPLIEKVADAIVAAGYVWQSPASTTAADVHKGKYPIDDPYRVAAPKEG